jgi:hypothetical protein
VPRAHVLFVDAFFTFRAVVTSGRENNIRVSVPLAFGITRRDFIPHRFKVHFPVRVRFAVLLFHFVPSVPVKYDLNRYLVAVNRETQIPRQIQHIIFCKVARE